MNFALCAVRLEPASLVVASELGEEVKRAFRESGKRHDCGSIPLVTPGDPEKSALIMVLSGPCSDDLERMPRGCTDVDGHCVPPEYIDALAQWIAEGAAHP
jgi:hypothetical protein